MALMRTRASNLNDVLNYELAAVPTSMFDEKSGLRMSMSKSIRKRKHHVEITNPSIGIRDAVVIGGCARLCVLQWPSKGFIKNIVLNFIKYATNKINSYNGHMQYLIDIIRTSRMPSASSCVSEHGMLHIDIGATVAKHSGIVQQLIAAHAVFGCDTVGCYHGIT